MALGLGLGGIVGAISNAISGNFGGAGGKLLVTPEKLISASQEFLQEGNEINNLTQQMLAMVHELKSTWAGEANMAYDTKFSGLEDDMSRIFSMINEHSSDLEAMAQNYQLAETTGVETSNALTADVIS